MPPIGPGSRPERFAKLDGRTRLAKLSKTLRSELTAHVGGNPSATQSMLIGQAVQLQLHLALLDKQTADGVEMNGHDSRYYLAWSNSLARLLTRIGMKAAPVPKATLADHLAARSGAAS
jgi:hypothetical protein